MRCEVVRVVNPKITEKEVNAWLSANPNVKIQNISSFATVHGAFICFYIED